MIKAMPSPVHECAQDWFLYILSKMQHDGFVPWSDWFDRISRNAGMGGSPEFFRLVGAQLISCLCIDFRAFKDAYRGSWKQPDFAIRSLDLDRPNLIIETGFSQSDESLQRKVQLWLEGSRGVVQVVIVVKLREGAIPSPVEQDMEEHDGSFSSKSNGGSDDDDDNRSSASINEVLTSEDGHLVGPISITIELWRWRNGVYLDRQLVSISAIFVRYFSTYY